MKRGLLISLATTVVMAATLLGVDSRAANPNPAAKAFPATPLLTQADDAWPNDPARFDSLLTQLHQHEDQLTDAQRWQLRFLDAWQPAFDGNYAKADPILHDVMDHSGNQALTIRAMAMLIRDKFLSRNYADAYSLANTLMAELPRVTDPKAREEGMVQVIVMLNRVAVGQYDLALQYARQMKASLPSGNAQCYASALETQSLLYAGKVTSSSPEFQTAIHTCLAAGVPQEVVPLQLDLASEMIDEGHADRAITFLQHIAPDVRKSRYTAYLASLPVTLAQAYVSQGNAAKARQYALASIAITGKNSPLWPLQAAYKVLYQAEKMSGHYAAALAYHEKYAAHRMVSMSDARASALAYQIVRQQVQAKKMKLDALSTQNKILQLRQKLAEKATETSRLYIVLLLVMLGVIVLWLLRLKHSQLRFRRLARHDGLTEVFNRQHFLDETERSLRQLHKTGSSACLVMLDLDHFKQVNDHYGHAAGDKVLQRTVATCRGELRSSDVFGRLGGEEFGILMPSCSPEQGLEIASRIRSAIADLVIELAPGTSVTVSASFGLACSDHSGYALGQLFSDADAALYRAKSSGRNRVVVDTGDDVSATSRPCLQQVT